MQFLKKHTSSMFTPRGEAAPPPPPDPAEIAAAARLQAATRAWRVRDANRTHRRTQRRVATALLRSERAYVGRLHRLRTAFEEPLRAAPPHLLTADARAALFGAPCPVTDHRCKCDGTTETLHRRAARDHRPPRHPRRRPSTHRRAGLRTPRAATRGHGRGRRSTTTRGTTTRGAVAGEAAAAPRRLRARVREAREPDLPPRRTISAMIGRDSAIIRRHDLGDYS